ncbi:MAG TPA: hypothetical protein VEL47_03475 [Myxococcota bacterium]|nr:hypothetical protein [Myxococcota bacterium]
MKECCGKKSCDDNEKCRCECVPTHEGCHDEEGASRHAFLELADCAWMEVLKEKIKEQILATDKERLTELAKIIAEGNQQRWKTKMSKKHHCHEFEEKLCAFFAKSKK